MRELCGRFHVKSSGLCLQRSQMRYLGTAPGLFLWSQTSREGDGITALDVLLFCLARPTFFYSKDEVQNGGADASCRTLV